MYLLIAICGKKGCVVVVKNVAGQLCLFDLVEVEDGAKSCFTGRTEKKEKLTELMKKLVPDGEFFIYVGKHPLVMRKTKLKREEIQKGHEFYHYMVGDAVYAGIFVG